MWPARTSLLAPASEPAPHRPTVCFARDAASAAREGRSAFLAARLADRAVLIVRDVIEASSHGDVVAVELLNRSGALVGSMLAALVNFYNPSLVIIGGGVASAGDMHLATIRQNVYSRSLPLATRDLRIVGDRDRTAYSVSWPPGHGDAP